MDEEAPDGPGEGAADGLVHQDAPDPLADEARHEPEKGELHLVLGPEIEFEQADIGAVLVMKRIGLDLRIVEDRGDARRPSSPPG